MSLRIAPSILSADFARLGEDVAAAEAGGADLLHVDVMDGRFVPNITVGIPVMESLAAVARVPLDVHLMIVEPERLIPDFVAAGADKITVHQEAVTHLDRAVHQIRDLGATAGVSLNPSTPDATLTEILPELDLVLVMSVNPGFGGQSFIPGVLPKVERLRAAIDERGLATELEVDGGIKPDNVARVVTAGANVIVAGSAVYNDRMTVAEAVAAMRAAVEGMAGSGVPD